MKDVLGAIVVVFFLIGCENSKKEHVTNSEKDSKTMYEVGELNVSIQIPASWKVESDSANLLIFKEICSDEVIFCTNAVVTVVNNTDSLTIEQITAIYIQNFKKKFNEMKLVAVTDSEIDGFKSKVIDYKVFENNVHLGSTAVFLLREGKILSFNFSAENRPEGNYANRRKIFFDVLSSVDLLEPKLR